MKKISVGELFDRTPMMHHANTDSVEILGVNMYRLIKDIDSVIDSICHEQEMLERKNKILSKSILIMSISIAILIANLVGVV